MVASLGLVVVNNGEKPTFVRGASKSFIDLTMVSEDLSVNVEDWEVLDEQSLSLHRLIAFKVSGKSIPKREQWRRGPINKERLTESLAQMNTQQSEKSPEEMVTILKRAYEKSTPKVRTKNGKIPFWWNEEIRELRERVLKSRRNLTRARRNQEETELVSIAETYKNLRKQLVKEISNSKKRSWNSLLNELDKDVHGDGYKIVKKRMNAEGPGVELTKEAESALINSLFPEAQRVVWARSQAQEIPPFNVTEVREAAQRLKNRKAPGPDGVPAEVVKVAADAIGEYVTSVYNDLLLKGIFPEIWKSAKIVFIEKPKKNRDTKEKSYRLLCLIDTTGKLYEALLNKRAMDELNRSGGLSPHQHGFRAGHSTMDAVKWVLERPKTAHRTLGAWCLLGLVDVKNAFNSASWPHIIQAMEEKQISPYITNIVKDNLSKRTIKSKLGNRKECTAGVPQGSVLGPTLWNIMYDGILRMATQEGVSMVGMRVMSP